MRITTKLFVSFAILFWAFSLSTTKIHALSMAFTPAEVTEQTGTVVLQIRDTGKPSSTLWICKKYSQGNCSDSDGKFDFQTDASGNADVEICADGNQTIKKGPCGPSDYWQASTYNARLYNSNNDANEAVLYTLTINVARFIPKVELVTTAPNGNPDNTSQFTLNVCGWRRPLNNSRNTYDSDLKGTNGTANPSDPPNVIVPFGGAPYTCGDNGEWGPFQNGTYSLNVKNEKDQSIARFTFEVKDGGGSISGGTSAGGGGVGTNPCSGGQCCTALGCISTTVKGFTKKILGIATGIAGGIALILMVIGSIRVLTSSGDPKAVGAGREMIVAAVAGLLFLIFAVLILRFIGVNILKGVPGMGT